MKTKDFNDLVEAQLVRCAGILCKKGPEYGSEDDRLHNFKAAAKLQQTTPRKALMGMMAKHTVSVYDMCESGLTYSDEIWDEKITDSINYLILLKGILQDEKAGKLSFNLDNKGQLTIADELLRKIAWDTLVDQASKQQ